MRIIEQLNKLPIKTGEYLVLPNMVTPYFIIPLHSRSVFIKAVRLVKTKNSKGLLKKIALQLIPFFLLKKLFPTVKVNTNHNVGQYNQLVLPWNQDVCNKFTIFNFSDDDITLIKIGFDRHKSMICNEYESILKAKQYGNNCIPELRDFSENKEYAIIETTFYKGGHLSELPKEIVDFLTDIKKKSIETPLLNHPYIVRVLSGLITHLEKEGLHNLVDNINHYYKLYEKELIPIVLMHSDCSLTNVIVNPNRQILIDWEECVVDGVPIDIAYFDFRMHLDNGKTWTVNTAISYLVVLHYCYLQVKHNNMSQLAKLNWTLTEENSTINLKV